MGRIRPMIASLVALLMLGSVCGEDRMSLDEIVNRINTEVTPGMRRSAVEQKLDALPVEYVYVSREYLEAIEQATVDGVPLSGRFDVSTQYEERGLGLRRIAIFVNLDEQDEVVNVRVEEVTTGL